MTDKRPPRDPDAFAEKHWPWLLILFCGCILWYYQLGNLFAGIAGFAGLGWLGWSRLVKPNL